MKASRFITHIKRLRDITEPLNAFISRVSLLKEKTGPILYQLPPNMKRNDDIFETFVSNLPRKYRHVVEFRNETWLCDTVFEIMRRYNVAFCVFDMPGLICPPIATADFGYIRLHGSTALYSSCYTDIELHEWANKIKRLGNGLTAVFIYFNNDMEAYAIQNALTMRNLLTG